MIDEFATELLEHSIKKENNHSPITFATVVYGGVKGQRSHKSGLLVLLDTGCSHSIMSAAIAKHVKWPKTPMDPLPLVMFHAGLAMISSSNGRRFTRRNFC
jgi:hypothetical protein